MSLKLQEAIPGRPNELSSQCLDVLEVEGHGYVVYLSSSNVVLLDERLNLKETLVFWDALPHRASSSTSQTQVQGVKCDPAECLILAWSDTHVVIWQYSKRRWTVHSTILSSNPITRLDFQHGTLVLGTSAGMEVWRMDPSAQVTVWDRLWERAYPAPTSIQLSPVLGHIAWIVKDQKGVYILGMDRAGQPMGVPQEMRHPREVECISWRKPNGDAHLYTITTNSVLRIYSPVLDDPTWFQLLSTIGPDAFTRSLHVTSANSSEAKTIIHPFGVIWPLDADVLRQNLKAMQDTSTADHGSDNQVSKMIHALRNEESDVVAWLSPQGELVLRSIINMDRKPPTLLRSLPLSNIRLSPSSLPFLTSPVARLLHTPNTGLTVVSLSSGRITAHRFSLTKVLAKDPSGIQLLVGSSDSQVELSQRVRQFVRTPNGRGLLVVGEEGEIGAWYKRRNGETLTGQNSAALQGRGLFKIDPRPHRIAIFAKGRGIVTFFRDKAGGHVALQHLDDGQLSPTEPVLLPDFSLAEDDDIKMLLAVSDVDDGYESRRRKTQRAIVVACSASGRAWVWRVISPRDPTSASELAFSDSTSKVTSAKPEVHLISTYSLPIESSAIHPHDKPALVLPVDPMGWHQNIVDWTMDTPLQDMVLTVTVDGCLEFWRPHMGQHHQLSTNARPTRINGTRFVGKGESPIMDGRLVNGMRNVEHGAWERSGIVRTGKNGVLMARCSSRKKTVLVCQTPSGKQEMTIWDSNVSEFSTGLESSVEYEYLIISEPIQDLDWTTTSDLQSVLAVGYKHRVVLICEQRLSYVDPTPGWAPFLTIDMLQYDPRPICDSIWLAGGSLAIGAGNHIYLFSRFLDRGSPEPSPAPSIKSSGTVVGPEEPEDIFQLIAHQNGPLWDCHPTVLGQCLLWNKIDLVKTILITLATSLREAQEAGRRRLRMKRLDPSEFYAVQRGKTQVKAATDSRYDGLFSTQIDLETNEDDPFTSALVRNLIERLDGPVRLPLDDFEKSMLATVAQGTLEVEELRRSLDHCGLRYLLSLRFFVNYNRRASTSGANTPLSSGMSGQLRPQQRLSFRNIVWAMHSESQELLLNAATNTCMNGKMLWGEAKNLGVFLWLRSAEVVRNQMELVARNRFMLDEDRDPTSCSLIFFALGKKKVVHGLWRQAPGHKEQTAMLKFLANDFDTERWKTAAVKNAYALLSKQRYEYAAAFFMLAGKPQDAINICLRQLADWQLAFALARVVEGSTDGPLVRSVLSDTVVPLAFAGGHRWLATWAFWLLGRRDLAVRVLLSPMDDVAYDWSPENELSVGNPENDDPSLLLLFQHLKSKSLQTAKGTNEIPEKVEFDFVLHNARVFFRMGCHALALDLLRSWNFDRPFFPHKPIRSRRPSSMGTPASPSRSLSTPHSARRPSFLLSSHGRHESMFMDLDVLAEADPSEPVTRVPSPTPIFQNTADPETPDLIEIREELEKEMKPRKMGNLMKELKQDVRQGAAEFDMDSFF
ncbi:hypothetical protein TREMEDRAFT_24795 [Tremella mesenterica DSM 1558]|uniref:uncharacterized protein n=1 Tax=Tremella mesenterica (strain ATCC 24925 / CBS 8224 / DSM 1558 / NBRC 9311 / NRRL Y-6157 / RJB 2259-6 / UBC 559-6) TaxID=578456 RepID=UPI0003F4A1BD|nr:uncharacterized protein TREMEDRAFT_24795 [Tremella mesenterica DSM 1558]EIW73255.1 hypothetical protein TREMEDRAFT_24795 [Tremella mesenterica DSM 1558]